LFQEKVSSVQYGCSIIAFIGVILIGFNGQVTGTGEISYFWMGMGVVSAVLSGIAYNAISKLKTTEAPINIVIYFPMLALPITGIACLFDFVMPRGIEWLMLLAIGVFTQIAQVLMTKAFMLANTSVIVPFQYLGAIYALISGWFIFDEQLQFAALVGIGLILVGVILGTIFRKGIPSRTKEHT
jgi:drug/metabolite transporter (DMT)-like permease